MENKVINLYDIKEKKEGKVIQFPGPKGVVSTTPAKKQKNKKAIASPKQFKLGVKLPKTMISKKICLSLAIVGAIAVGSTFLVQDNANNPEQYILKTNEDIKTNFESVLSELEKEVANNANVANISNDVATEDISTNGLDEDTSTIEIAPSVFDTGLSISSSAKVTGEYSDYTINFTATVDGSKLKEADGLLDFDKKHIKVEITSVTDSFTDEERAIFAGDDSMLSKIAKENVDITNLAKKDLESSAGRDKLKQDLLAAQ